jgi:hypothetical protein
MMSSHWRRVVEPPAQLWKALRPFFSGFLFHLQNLFLLEKKKAHVPLVSRHRVYSFGLGIGLPFHRCKRTYVKKIIRTPTRLFGDQCGF